MSETSKQWEPKKWKDIEDSLKQDVDVFGVKALTREKIFTAKGPIPELHRTFETLPPHLSIPETEMAKYDKELLSNIVAGLTKEEQAHHEAYFSMPQKESIFGVMVKAPETPAQVKALAYFKQEPNSAALRTLETFAEVKASLLVADGETSENMNKFMGVLPKIVRRNVSDILPTKTFSADYIAKIVPSGLQLQVQKIKDQEAESIKDYELQYDPRRIEEGTQTFTDAEAEIKRLHQTGNYRGAWKMMTILAGVDGYKRGGLFETPGMAVKTNKFVEGLQQFRDQAQERFVLRNEYKKLLCVALVPAFIWHFGAIEERRMMNRKGMGYTIVGGY